MSMPRRSPTALTPTITAPSEPAEKTGARPGTASRRTPAIPAAAASRSGCGQGHRGNDHPDTAHHRAIIAMSQPLPPLGPNATHLFGMCGFGGGDLLEDWIDRADAAGTDVAAWRQADTGRAPRVGAYTRFPRLPDCSRSATPPTQPHPHRVLARPHPYQHLRPLTHRGARYPGHRHRRPHHRHARPRPHRDATDPASFSPSAGCGLRRSRSGIRTVGAAAAIRPHTSGNVSVVGRYGAFPAWLSRTRFWWCIA